jgi:hypothetical protein
LCSDQCNSRTAAPVPVRCDIKDTESKGFVSKICLGGKGQRNAQFCPRRNYGIIILFIKVLKQSQKIASDMVTLPPDKAGYMSRLTGAYPAFEER